MLVWLFRSMGALAPAALVAACNSAAGMAQGAVAASDVQVERSDAPPRNRCDASAAAAAVGASWEPALLGRVLADAGADEARMLHEDSLITKEYKQGRVNVVVDADGRVVRVYCG